jgi:hypothetical protein
MMESQKKRKTLQQLVDKKTAVRRKKKKKLRDTTKVASVKSTQKPWPQTIQTFDTKTGKVFSFNNHIAKEGSMLVRDKAKAANTGRMITDLDLFVTASYELNENVKLDGFVPLSKKVPNVEFVQSNFGDFPLLANPVVLFVRMCEPGEYPVYAHFDSVSKKNIYEDLLELVNAYLDLQYTSFHSMFRCAWYGRHASYNRHQLRLAAHDQSIDIINMMRKLSYKQDAYELDKAINTTGLSDVDVAAATSYLSGVLANFPDRYVGVEMLQSVKAPKELVDLEMAAQVMMALGAYESTSFTG